MADNSVERRMVIGLICYTEYIQKVYHIFDIKLLDSSVARHLSTWCLEYFDKYQKAPFLDIEGIYIDKLKTRKISEELGEEIQEDILPDLNEDFLENGMNIEYLSSQTFQFFREKRIEAHTESIKSKLALGDVDEAEKLTLNYQPIVKERGNEVDFNSESFEEKLKGAFEKAYSPVLHYPGALGDMMGEHLVKGGFIGLLASDKVGKTFFLLDMAMRGMKQGSNVAFFQAGDMTESQQIMRIAIYLARKSNKKKYCGLQWEPVKDCVYNQIDQCDLSERTCDFGLYESTRDDLSDYKQWYNQENLIKAYKENPDYTPCTSCKKWRHSNWGSAWIKKVYIEEPLVYEEALEIYREFKEKYKGKFKLATYANGTLSVPMMESRLGIWEKEENFTAHIILVDYADLLVSESYNEYRHKQNDVWMGLRGLSQKKHSLVVAPTQADANAYSQGLLRLSNFSEDKRKYSHVTAMFGLNRDPKGIEKRIGLMRINELVVREGEYDNYRQVTVLSNLKRGRPIIGSFW